MCVTLNEGYLRSANRGSNNLYRFFLSKYNRSAFNEKTNFFGLSFLLFFRLPIYESIAAIFWQSASYVIRLFPLSFLTVHHLQSLWTTKQVSFACPHMYPQCQFSFLGPLGLVASMSPTQTQTQLTSSTLLRSLLHQVIRARSRVLPYCNRARYVLGRLLFWHIN